MVIPNGSPPTLTRKPLDWFRFDPNQPRKTFLEEELRELEQNIHTVGQISPVVACSDGLLRAGEKRVRALLLGGRIKDALTLISDTKLTESETLLLQLSENIHRSDLSDQEFVKACQQLLVINKGWKQQNLAAYLHKSPATISKRLAILGCTRPVQDAFFSGKISITDGWLFSQMTPEQQAVALPLKLSGAIANCNQLAELLKAAASGTQAGGDEAVEGGGKGAVSRFKGILPGVTISVAAEGDGLTMGGLIKALEDMLQEAKAKQKIKGMTVSNFSKVLKEVEKERQEGNAETNADQKLAS